MSRLSITFLILVLSTSNATLALAKQNQVAPIFPSRLSQAIDKSHENSDHPAPSRNTANQKNVWRSGSSTPRYNAQAQSLPHTPRRKPTLAQTYTPPPTAPEPESTSVPAETPSRTLAQTPAQFATTTPTSSASYSLNDQTLDRSPEQAWDPQVQPLPEFGTVMMFPADESSSTNDIMIGQTEAPPMDTRPTAPENAFTNQSPFKLASSSKMVARPLNPTRPAANTPPVVQPNRLATSMLPTDTAPVNQILVTTVVGPDRMLQDSPEEFEINVVNNSEQGAGKIMVQIVVPEALTITRLDRKAWMDGENRTVSWMINELPRGHKEVIRYSVVSSTPGRHRQSISVGMNNSFQGRTDFDAVVISSERYEVTERSGFKN